MKRKAIPYPKDDLEAEVSHIKKKNASKKARRRAARKESRADSDDALMRGSADTDCLQHHGKSAPRDKTAQYPMQSENLSESVNGVHVCTAHTRNRSKHGNSKLMTHLI
jgi:hypothetical protein